MATYPISTQQSEIDSYIDMCNARPELARPTAQLPDGTLIAFPVAEVAEDTVTGKADADGRSYTLTLSRTPGASQVMEAPTEMLFDSDKQGKVLNSAEDVAAFIQRFDSAREKGNLILPYLRFFESTSQTFIEIQMDAFVDDGNADRIPFTYHDSPDSDGNVKEYTLIVDRDSPTSSFVDTSAVSLQKKTDNSLDTAAKTVTGAINELAARTKVEAVDTLPESPDANTLYVTPASE